MEYKDKFTQRRDAQMQKVKPAKNKKFREFFKKAKSEVDISTNELLTVTQVENILKNVKISEDEKKFRIITLIATIHYSHDKRMHKDELMNTINKHFNKGLDSSDEKQINIFVNDINKVLLKNEINKPLDYDFPEIKVGNEFTFTCSAFTSFKSKKESTADKEADHDANDLNVYNLKVGLEPSDKLSWMKVMNNYGFKGELKGQGKKGEDRLYYSFKLEDGSKWGYTVSLDDQCIEIITDPIAASSLVQGEVANIMDMFIFGVASQIGVGADDTVGGGHINIDKEGAFPEDYNRKILTKFLKEFYSIKESDFWKKEDPGPINAPFPDELGLSKEEVEALLNTPDDKFIAKLESEIFTKSHKDLDLERLDEEDVRNKNFKHYQAVNLEHLLEEDLDAQRIEIRRVRAQKDRIKLAQLLARIFDILDKAKTKAKYDK